jgi:hypothetical protein
MKKFKPPSQSSRNVQGTIGVKLDFMYIIIYFKLDNMYVYMVLKGHNVMTKGLRSAQQVSSLSQGVHLL